MRGNQNTALSAAMQAMNGPITRGIRNEITRLGELISFLPEDKIFEARRSVMALAECCIRVKGLEEMELGIDVGGIVSALAIRAQAGHNIQ